MSTENTENPVITNRILGAIMGGAFGDAMGLPLELWNSEFIQKKLSDQSNESLKEKVITINNIKYVNGFIKTHKNDFIGEYSDDTEMTLGTIESILHIGGVTPSHLLGTFKKNFKESRGYGHNTSKILTGETVNTKSDSNGGLMRICPIALWNITHKDWELEKDVITDLKVTNHDTLKSIQTCMLFCKIIIYLVNTSDPTSISVKNFVNFIEKELSNYPEISSQIRLVLDNFISGKNESTIVSQLETYSTDCVETLQKVLNALLFHWDNPDFALSSIISYGGDTDTQTGILGSILGARFGLGFMNGKYVQVENNESILDLAKRFASLTHFRAYNNTHNIYREEFGL